MADQPHDDLDDVGIRACCAESTVACLSTGRRDLAWSEIRAALADIQPLVAKLREARKLVHEYETAICWDTTCLSCSAILDAATREREGRERAEQVLGRVAALLREWRGMDPAASLDFGDAAAQLDDALNGGDR